MIVVKLKSSEQMNSSKAGIKGQGGMCMITPYTGIINLSLRLELPTTTDRILVSSKMKRGKAIVGKLQYLTVCIKTWQRR